MKGHGKTKDTPALTRIRHISIVPCVAPYFRKSSSLIRFSGVVSVSVIIVWVTLFCTTVYRTFVMTTIGSVAIVPSADWKPSDHTRDVPLIADVAELIPGFLLSVLHHAFRSSPPFGLLRRTALTRNLRFNMLPCLGLLDHLLQRWVLLHCKVHHLVIGLLPFMFLSSKIMQNGSPGRSGPQAGLHRQGLPYSQKRALPQSNRHSLGLHYSFQPGHTVATVILYKLVILFAPFYLSSDLLNFIPHSSTVSYLLLHKNNAS